MPWDSGRTGTSVHMTREERTGTDVGLMGRNEARGREEAEKEPRKRKTDRKREKNNYQWPIS